MDQTQTKPAQSRLLIATVLEPKDDLNEVNFNNNLEGFVHFASLDMDNPKSIAVFLEI